jgi:hypothetical protein
MTAGLRGASGVITCVAEVSFGAPSTRAASAKTLALDCSDRSGDLRRREQPRGYDQVDRAAQRVALRIGGDLSRRPIAGFHIRPCVTAQPDRGQVQDGGRPALTHVPCKF